MSDDFTLLRRTDPVEGEMLVGLLQREGIPARLVGKSPALLGVGPSIIETRLEVPESLLERARAVIDEVAYVGANASADEPTEEPEAPAAEPERRNPIMGAGIAFLIPGGCHLHARRPWTALLLAAGLVLAFAVAVGAGASRFASAAAVAGLVGLLACDVAGGLRAVRAFNRGVRVGRGGQLWRGLVLLVIGGAVATAVGFASLIPAWLRSRQLSTLAVSCTEGAIVVENLGSAGREISIDGVHAVETWGIAEEDRRPVALGSSPDFSLPPGGSHALSIQVAESTLQGCRPAAPRPQVRIAGLPLQTDDSWLQPSARPSSCRLVFSLAITRPGGRVDLETEGSCRPKWGSTEAVRGELGDPGR